MPHIDKGSRVGLRIRYNGYVHKAVGLLGDETESSKVYIFSDQLPRGYHDEHGTHQIDYIFKTHCIIPDPSGEHGWSATEEVDLDSFAQTADDTE